MMIVNITDSFLIKFPLFVARLLWLCCYMSQMNPLIGPEVDSKTAAAMKLYWGGLHHDIKEDGQ